MARTVHNADLSRPTSSLSLGYGSCVCSCCSSSWLWRSVCVMEVCNYKSGGFLLWCLQQAQMAKNTFPSAFFFVCILAMPMSSASQGRPALPLGIIPHSITLHRPPHLAPTFTRSRARGASMARPTSSLRPLSLNVSSTGEYMMHITLGTPPLSLSAIVDTGSTLVWVQFAPCPGCTNPGGPIFQPHLSSSYRPLPCGNSFCTQIRALNFSSSLPPLGECFKTCQFEFAYGENSTAVGELATETLVLRRENGGKTLVSGFALGCAHQTNGNLDTGGLVGLDRGPYSFISQLGNRIGNAFSYCLVHQKQAAPIAGILHLGSTSFLREEGARYTPLLVNNIRKANAFYYVRLLSITVGTEKLNVPKEVFEISQDGRGGVIFDSGTASLILAESAFTALHQALKSLVPYPELALGGDLQGLICYNISGLKNPRFPQFILNLEETDLEVQEENIFIQVDSSSICVAVLSGDFINSDLGTLTIIGNLVQQNLHLMFDLQHNQLGFVQKDCRSSS